MRLIVKNTRIEIHNYELGSIIGIENCFQYYRPITHDIVTCAMYYDKEKKILYLPRGIDIWWLESKTDTRAEYINDSYHFKQIDMKLLVAPRENQKEALRFMVSSGEYTGNKNATQLSLNLNTGKGKTYISIATIAYYGCATILIMSSNSYITQWIDRIVQYTDLDRRDIKHIQGAGAINRLFKNPKEKNTAKIYLVTHSTLHSYASSYGWDMIGELFEHLEIGIKIYDEAHQNFDNISMIDFYTNVWKTFYVTASPAKSSEEENKIYSLYFKNVPAIELFDEQEDPHTKYIAIKFNSCPSIYDIRECKNAYGLDRIKYMNYFVKKPQYYQLLRIILEMALKSTGKCLIYIGLNDAIVTTYNWIRDNYPELYNDVGIFTTLNSADDKYEALNKKIILSTTKSAGAAVDIANLKMTVVLNEPFKSQVITQQTIGRTRAADTLYIDCVDTGFRQFLKYYSYKQPIVNKYCTENNVIRLSNSILEERAQSIIEKNSGRYILASRELAIRIDTP